MSAVRQTVVMLTSSYPRFPGDPIATFMEPIAKGVAALGHDVHLVAPWHPAWRRPDREDGVQFHLFRYAPTPALNVFGYAAALRSDVSLRASAVAVAPLALVAGAMRTRQVARATRATVVHAHWVIPSGAMAAVAASGRPLVTSLHGSDVFVAERHPMAAAAARLAFARSAWVTACSEDLRSRAVRLGASPERIAVVPYGVNSDRFKPDAAARADIRARLGIDDQTPMVFAFGRLVAKKGFEFLIDATAALTREFPTLVTIIAGEGDSSEALRARTQAAGVTGHVRFPGAVPQHEIPLWLAGADVAVAPSVHDEAGNVDGLPNTVLEIMASGTPLVATLIGGIVAVATDGRTARLVPERDSGALAEAIAELLHQPALGAAIGNQARDTVSRAYSWKHTAEQFDAVYRRATAAGRTPRADAE